MVLRKLETLVRHAAHHVGDEDLLGQAEHEAVHAVGEIVQVVLALGQFMGHVAVADNGTRHQLGKE